MHTVGGHMMTISESRRPFVPGMGVDWLLPLYDPLTRLLGLNRARRDLLLQAYTPLVRRVVAVWCGARMRVVLVKQRCPGVVVVGGDPDKRAPARSRGKAQRIGANIQFHRAFSDAHTYPDASF